MRKRVIVGFAFIFLLVLLGAGLVSLKMGELRSANEARCVTDEVSRLLLELELATLQSAGGIDGLKRGASGLEDVTGSLRGTIALMGDLDKMIDSDSLPREGCGICHEELGKFVQEIQEIRGDLGETSREMVRLAEMLQGSEPGAVDEFIEPVAETFSLARNQISLLRSIILPMTSHTDTQVAGSIARIRKGHNLIVVLGIFILLVSLLLMSMAVVSAVSHLAKATQAVALGDYSYRVPVKGNNEAAVLAQRFNTMAEVLESREKSLLQQKIELESLNESLERKVHERTRQLEERKDELKRKYEELEENNEKIQSSYLKLQSTADELERARAKLQDNFNVLKVMNRELKRANEVKNKFLSIMSHELRTPLTVINGYLSLVLEKDYGRPTKELRDILTVIKDQSRSQLGLIEELLDLTRIESGEFKLHREALSVDDLISKALENLRPKFQEKEIELKVWVDPNIPAVFWDFQKILQVMQNLLDNSVKFTPVGGKIAVSAQFKNAFVEISVQDSGIGIPKDQIEHVFERFFQADSSSTRQFGGSGLGLSIVHEIVQAHQGKIFVESDEGEGTCFLILLPVGDWNRGRQLEPAASEAPEGPEPLRPQGHGEKILVVDDDEAFLKMMKMLLPREGYDIHVTPNSPKALGQAKRYGSDLIILDLMMPHVDGYEVCRRIRKDDLLKNKPILVVSAAGGDEVVRKVMEAGADAHITKPFDQDELLAQVRRLLKAYRKGPQGSEKKADTGPKDS